MSNQAYSFSADNFQEYQGKDQNWDSETTTYWFETTFGRFGCVESGSDKWIIDADGNKVNELAIHLELGSAVTDEMRAD